MNSKNQPQYTNQSQYEELNIALKERFLREKFIFLRSIQRCTRSKQYDLLNKAIIDLATLTINYTHITKQNHSHFQDDAAATQRTKAIIIIAGVVSLLLIVAGMVTIGKGYHAEKDDKDTNEKALRYGMISVVLGGGAALLGNLFTIFSNQISRAYETSVRNREKKLTQKNLHIQFYNDTSNVLQHFEQRSLIESVVTYAINPESAPGLNEYEEQAKTISDTSGVQ